MFKDIKEINTTLQHISLHLENMSEVKDDSLVLILKQGDSSSRYKISLNGSNIEDLMGKIGKFLNKKYEIY